MRSLVEAVSVHRLRDTKTYLCERDIVLGQDGSERKAELVKTDLN